MKRFQSRCGHIDQVEGRGESRIRDRREEIRKVDGVGTDIDLETRRPSGGGRI